MKAFTSYIGRHLRQHCRLPPLIPMTDLELAKTRKMGFRGDTLIIFFLNIRKFPIAIFADDTTLYSKCDQSKLKRPRVKKCQFRVGKIVSP